MADDTKTPADWLAEIQRLGKEINTNSTLIGEKRAEKKELALAAVNNDVDAIKRTRKLATEIDALIWSSELLDDALIVANRKLQETEQAVQSAKLAAILAERDRVLAERDAMYPTIAAKAAELVALIKETDIMAKTIYSLSLDADQDQAGWSYLRQTRRSVGEYVKMELAQAGLEGFERPLSGPYRQQLREMFGGGEGSNVVAGDTTPEESELVA